MRKVLIYILLFAAVLSLCCTEVNAQTVLTGVDCNSGILTSDAVDLIREVLGYFRVLGPIALIIFVALDFANAVIAQSPDAVKKAESKVIPRAIATLLLFFVPTIVRFILGLEGVRSAIEIPNDPMCGTMNSYPTVEIFDNNSF